jgi:hypothetical protein
MGGQKVVWRPLKVGDHIDIDANYGASNMIHLKRYAELASRIVSVDGQTKAQLNKGDVDLVREWEDYDLVAFQEEIVSRELARSVALAPQRPGGAVAALEQVVSKIQVAATELGVALTAVIQKAKEAEQTQPSGCWHHSLVPPSLKR